MSLVYLIDGDGHHIYTGDKRNEKIARLESQDGISRVPSAPPDRLSKWNGSAWVTSDVLIHNKESREWERQMEESDKRLTRFDEDTFDLLSSDEQARYPQQVKDRVAAKKLLRSQKP